MAITFINESAQRVNAGQFVIIPDHLTTNQFKIDKIVKGGNSVYKAESHPSSLRRVDGIFAVADTFDEANNLLSAVNNMYQNVEELKHKMHQDVEDQCEATLKMKMSEITKAFSK